MAELNSGAKTALATHDDITGILGDLDTEKVLTILSLHPTIGDLEEASIWLAGDADVYGAAQPIKGTASKIVTILTAEEEEERRG
jgi:hypothetical protein